MSGASSARRASRQNNPYETPPLSPFPGTETHLALSHNSRSTSQQFGEEPFSDSAVIHGDKVEVRVRHGSSRRNSPASSALRRSRQELPAFTGNDSPYSFSGGSSLSVSHNQVLLLQEGEESDGDFPNQGNLPGDLVASETAVYSERKAKGEMEYDPKNPELFQNAYGNVFADRFVPPPTDTGKPAAPSTFSKYTAPPQPGEGEGQRKSREPQEHHRKSHTVFPRIQPQSVAEGTELYMEAIDLVQYYYRYLRVHNANVATPGELLDHFSPPVQQQRTPPAAAPYVDPNAAPMNYPYSMYPPQQQPLYPPGPHYPPAPPMMMPSYYPMEGGQPPYAVPGFPMGMNQPPMPFNQGGNNNNNNNNNHSNNNNKNFRNRRHQLFNEGNAVLFVGQLSYDATRGDVEYLFSTYGTVQNVVMFKTDENNRKKDAHHHDEPATDENGEIIGSSAFVSYATTKEADSAILSLHDKYSMDGRGRRLQVSYCLKTDKISTFGYQHAMRLHALNPANPKPIRAPTDE